MAAKRRKRIKNAMKIPPFELERYFAKYEFIAPYLLCASDSQSFTLSEIFKQKPGAYESLQNLMMSILNVVQRLWQPAITCERLGFRIQAQGMYVMSSHT
jgi:hypothetical protein